MEFRVLGSLEIWDGGNQIEIAGTKRRALLALLVLHANEVVGKDRLVDELWGESAPRTAAASLHNHISRLRKVLGADLLVTRAWGYVLRADPDGVDLRRFEQLVADAEPLPAKQRAARLAEALALWRGPALADLVFEPALAKDIARIEEFRIAVLEARIDADLEIGQNAELVGELESLIAENPLRERLRGQLILALYRDGRQAEALEVYRETRRLLADELGLDPSPALRELERAVLRQDPSLHPVASGSGVGGEIQLMRRRWLVYAALAGAGALAASGIAVLTLGRHGSAQQALSPEAAQAAQVPRFRPSHPRAGSVLKVLRPPAERRVRVDHKLQDVKPKAVPARPSTSAQTIVTHPASPKKPKKSTPSRRTRTKPAPSWVRLEDDFSQADVNPLLWNWGSLGTGTDLGQRNGRLEMTMHRDSIPDGRWNATDVYYMSACTFTGDFDARIDYTLIDWPPASGAVVAFSLSFPGNVVNLVRASRATGSEDYSFAAPTGEARNFLTTDASGGFRMTRVGGVVTAYIRSGGRWSEFEQARHVGPVRLQPVLWASGSDFAHKDVMVAFDNFVVRAPYSPCP